MSEICGSKLYVPNMKGVALKMKKIVGRSKSRSVTDIV